MRLLLFAIFPALLAGLAAAEPVPQWEVWFPEPAPVQKEPPGEPEPESGDPVDFVVISSRSSRMHVKDAPPMPGLPAVEGTVNLTVQLVADPRLPEPPPLPVPSASPEAMERWAELRNNYRGTDLLFLSATVFDGKRTLLTIYPNGRVDDSVTAWSNLDFLHFTGKYSGYQVRYSDGRIRNVSLLMGVSPVNTFKARQLAARSGRPYQEQVIPELPDSAVSGPAFVVVQGEQTGAAAETLEQLHELYRANGRQMAEAHHAMMAQQAALRLHYQKNPPKPADVTVRFWRKDEEQP